MSSGESYRTLGDVGEFELIGRMTWGDPSRPTLPSGPVTTARW